MRGLTRYVLRQTMEKTPGLRGVVEWADRVIVDLDKGVRDLIASYTQDASYLIQGSVAAILQLIEMRQPASDVADRLRVARSHIERMSRILQDMREFARPSSGRRWGCSQ